MTRWSNRRVGVRLCVLALATANLPSAAAAAMRGGAAHPFATRAPQMVRNVVGARGDARRDVGGSPGGRSARNGGRLGDVGFDGDDLGYGLAGGFVGAAVAPAADGPFPYGAAPPVADSLPGGPFPGARPYAAAPKRCVAPQIIRIDPGPRAADKVKVVYGAPPCG